MLKETCTRKCDVTAEDEFSIPREVAAGMFRATALASVLYSMYISYANEPTETLFLLIVDDICIYLADYH